MFDYFNGFWNWAAEHPAQHNPTSTAIYFYILSIANQLGWKPEFNLSSTQVMDGCSIANYKTYKKHFDILVENGLIRVVRESKNQYTSNIIAMVNFTKALPKQDQSITEALPKQAQSTAHIHKTIKTNKSIKTNTDRRLYKTAEDVKGKEYFKDAEVNESFTNFLIERIARKKYPTDLAIETLQKKMRDYYKTKAEAIEGIEQSISNGWTGLFELNKKQSFKQPEQKVVTRASMGVKMQ